MVQATSHIPLHNECSGGVRVNWKPWERILPLRSDGVQETEVQQEEPTSYICEYGIRKICPQDIVHFSRPVEEIRQSEKMKKLRERVRLEGWNDPYPHDLHLELSDDSTYSVASGGNHRAALAQELDIPVIQALITVTLDATALPEDTRLVVSRLDGMAKITESLFVAKLKFFQDHYLDVPKDIYDYWDDELTSLDEHLRWHQQTRNQYLCAFVDELGWYQPPQHVRPRIHTAPTVKWGQVPINN